MVAFDSDERRKCAVDAIIRAMEGTTSKCQQADQPSVPPASAQASKPLSNRGPSSTKLLPVRASLMFRSPHALRHEFESYLREPKIAQTSSPFAGLRGVHTACDVVRSQMCRDVRSAWSYDVVRPRLYHVCVVVLIEHVQSIGGIHTRRDVVRTKMCRNPKCLDFCISRRTTSRVV